ncbi:MAG: Zn-ribbon domain-containing OB-fold protein [Bacillota bacterium]
MSAIKPLQEGLFHFSLDRPEEAVLIGSRCRRCAKFFFPRCQICAFCCGKELEEVILSREGTLKTYTVVRQGPPGWKGPLPYIIGEVRLSEGVVITTHLTGCRPEDIRIGEKMRLTVGVLREDGEGNRVVAHMFRPAGAGREEVTAGA